MVSVFADLLYQPPLPALLEMARATSRVRLGAACLNPYTLHPYEIAGQVAALDAASGGRAYLGLARGAWLGAIGIDAASPAAATCARPPRWSVRCCPATRPVSRGRSTGWRPAPGYAPRRRPASPPLLLGTWGPRGPPWPARSPTSSRWAAPRARRSSRQARHRVAAASLAAGRVPGGVRVVAGAVTVVDRDGAAARRRARSEVAKYLAVVARWTLRAGCRPVSPAIRRLVATGDDAAAGALIPDDVLDRFAFAGTPSMSPHWRRPSSTPGAGRSRLRHAARPDRRGRRRPAWDRGPAAPATMIHPDSRPRPGLAAQPG